MECRGRKIAEVQDTGLVYTVSFRPGRATQKDPESKKQKKKKIPKSKNYTLASIVLKAIPQIYFVNSRQGSLHYRCIAIKSYSFLLFVNTLTPFGVLQLQKDTYLFTSGSLSFKQIAIG